MNSYKLAGLLGLAAALTACKQGDEPEAPPPDPSWSIETARGSITAADTTLAEFPGVVGVPNIDDDDEDGRADWTQATLLPQENDLTSVGLVLDRLQATLSVSGPDLVRVWSDGVVVLGDGAPSDSWAPTSDQVELLIEFPEHLAQAVLTVHDLTNDTTTDVRLTAAPILLTQHLQPAERSWVMQVNAWGTSNAQMVDTMVSVLGDDIIMVPQNPYGLDVWVEDEFEFATLTSPEGRLDICIDSIRDRELDPMPEDMIEAPDVLVRSWGQGFANTYDSFGNLESSPPVTVDGVDYPFGRVYYGRKGRDGPTADLRTMLADQGVQRPFEIDTTFLIVGHIDEVTSWVPDPTAPRGFRFLFADPTEGYAIIDSMDPNTSLPKYAGRSSHNIRTVGEMQNDVALRAVNEDLVEVHLDPLLERFKEELALTDDEIIRVPFIFEEVTDWGSVQHIALNPGMVNMLVYTGSDGQSAELFIPDPFLRASISNADSDPMLTALRDRLPDSVTTHFVDDFDIYHLGWGEVHCGTNTQRTPVGEWWQSATHLLTDKLAVE